MANGKGDRRRPTLVPLAVYEANYQQAFGGKEVPVIVSDDGIISGGSSPFFVYDDQFAVSNRVLNGYNGWTDSSGSFQINSSQLISNSGASSFSQANRNLTGLDYTGTVFINVFLKIANFTNTDDTFIGFANSTVLVQIDLVSGSLIATTDFASDSVATAGVIQPSVAFKLTIELNPTDLVMRVSVDDVLRLTIDYLAPQSPSNFSIAAHYLDDPANGALTVSRVTINGAHV